ncbi:fimbrillin family protein [Prevotella melaninogenica]|uniref:fimbrillin family protein n=1 Tax=Prevotella melaninogenica TaxID=28132 RepID=UPI001BAA7476|nr:fimbrillin family protein [Prevotella melaninogenica]QUB57228.1 fimbrillin family protein [Prevotella melaninogenica]QUB59035.1 fimbrillin family protein [Prevotella melaninogenica]
MKFKKIYGLILSVVAVGLASCSSDLNNEGNTPINPTKTAKRSLTLSANNVTTRSYISLQDGNQWRKGDRFIVYNLTSPAGTDELVAKGDGANTLLKGDVTCADNNEIAVFFPYQQSAGHNQYKVDISLNNSNLTENGQVVNRAQDGKLENLKYFDFSYGKTRVRTTPGSNNVTGNVQMKKQYAVLRLKFKADGQELKNLKKLTVSNVITSGRFDMSTGQLTEKQKGDITITPSAPLDSFVVAVFPEEHFRPTFTVVGSDNKTYRFSVGVDLPIANADYAPYVVAVKEIAPYIEIDGVKWGKYNLQYSPGTHTDGWKDGYHLAKNPWDYFYTEESSYPLNEVLLRGKKTLGTEFDHFRWGDILYAHDYSSAEGPGSNKRFWAETGSINGRFSSDKAYGDLAAFVSDGKWQMPTAEQFADMMSKTGEYIGYYVDDSGNYIYGVLFDPTVEARLKGKVLDKNNTVFRESNKFATKFNFTYEQLKKFTKADFEKGIFFPMAGMYTYGSVLEKPGTQGAYWLATGGNATQAAAFITYISERREFFAGYTKSAMNPKRVMYSIRPIYVGQ